MDTQLVLNAVNLLGVTALGIQDALYMKIHKWMAYAYLISGLIISMILRSPEKTALSAVPGLILLIISIATKEKIGLGDCVTVIGLGLWTGIEGTLLSVFIGIGLSSVVSIIYMAVNKIKGLSGKKAIPFIPFLMCGLVVSIVSG